MTTMTTLLHRSSVDRAVAEPMYGDATDASEEFTTLEKRQFYQRLRTRWSENSPKCPFYATEPCGCRDLSFAQFAVLHLRRAHAKRVARSCTNVVKEDRCEVE